MKYDFDVFISYRGPERRFVERKLVFPLMNAGLNVAIDYASFGFGKWTLDNIKIAAERSRYTLLALTPAWLTSEWCEFEMKLVRHLDPAARCNRLIPVILIRMRVPSDIEFLTYCDLSNEREYASNLSRLLRLLKENGDA